MRLVPWEQMSLTSFIKTKNVRERFAQEFQKPRLGEKRELLAPPLTKNYSMVGTAFDYLLRFYLKRLNPKAHTQDWVAEEGVDLLDTVADAGALYKIASNQMQQAKHNYARYLKIGEFSGELIRSAIFLAEMDSVFRGEMWHPVFRGRPEEIKFRKKFLDPDEQDVADLRRLVSLLPTSGLRAKRVCILNPTFGRASSLVGGADADFIIDDMLVEVKTTKEHELQRNHFNQLIGYYCLQQIGRMRGAPKNHEILRFGVYYSRFGYLWTLDAKDVIDTKKFRPFLKWFRRELVKR
jgi:hypothetical protein